jgi:bacterioferritin-associated ferredoxin
MKWRTFGCGSAIASTSMHSVMVTEDGGRTLDEALAIRPQHITARLGGLPNRKIHCSVLSDKALRQAANDYFRKSGQTERIVVEGARVIDKILKITDHDIEEAVLEGADTVEKMQARTKVGTGDPSCLPEVEQLIRFYKEKYFG